MTATTVAPAIVRWLSTPRLTPYLAVASSHREALRLYTWNRELSGAVYGLLHMFEVILRNAIDEELSVWNGRQRNSEGSLCSEDWLDDPAALLTRLTRNGKDLRDARARAATTSRAWRPRRKVTHDDVLANVSLGTWRYLLPNNDPGRERIWKESLQHAFPQLSAPPRVLTAKVHDVHLLRNRVAHLEPLREKSVRSALADVLFILRAIDGVPEQWVSGQQRVSAVLRARPE